MKPSLGVVLKWPALGYAAHSQIPMTDLLSDIELAKVDPSSLLAKKLVLDWYLDPNLRVIVEN